MATFRLLHVTRTGGDTDGLAEFTNSDTVLMPCLLYTSPSPRDKRQSRMPSSA